MFCELGNYVFVSGQVSVTKKKTEQYQTRRQCLWYYKHIGVRVLSGSDDDVRMFFNPFASGIQKVLLSHITGLFSVKIQKKFLAIKNFSVNDTMSGPTK